MPYVADPATTEAGATFTDLLDELYARGYDYLNQDSAGRARAGRWINQSYAELALEEEWPFRLTTTSGAAPLTITDLDQVLSVTDTNNDDFELDELTERELTVWDLTTTGTPIYYYRDNLRVRVWPVSTTTISVRYFALPTDLVSATDTTLVPKRYMNTIVDGAVMRAAADRDNDRAVTLAERMYNRGLALMRRQLLVAPTHIEQRPGASEDS